MTSSRESTNTNSYHCIKQYKEFSVASYIDYIIRNNVLTEKKLVKTYTINNQNKDHAKDTKTNRCNDGPGKFKRIGCSLVWSEVG